MKSNKSKGKENPQKKEEVEEDQDEETSQRILASAINRKQKEKEKKNIRFELPANDSQETFISATSLSFPQEDDDYEDISKADPESLNKKHRFLPIVHSQPRKPSKKHCFHHRSSGSGLLIASSTSSKQLFEVSRASPSTSDANLHLVQGVYLGKVDVVKEAISNGADINSVSDKQTPLLLATEIRDARMVSYLLRIPKVDIDYRNESGQTALWVAVKNGFGQIVRLLLNHQCNVNIADNRGHTPLHVALFQQRPKLIKLLLAYGANIEVEDCFGESPIYIAAVKKPNLECLITLLKMGTNVNSIDISGIPLLSRAILEGSDPYIIEILVKFGASVNMQDLVSKKTPLHFAALKNDFRVAKILVKRGADVNAKTTYNCTALDEAVIHKSETVAKFLEQIILKKDTSPE